jgi:cytochrome P450
VAGHDTSASSIAAGLRAFIEHPDQWRRLVDDPGLLNTAADEIIRWASPSRHFLRTAAGPTTIRDVTFDAGDSVFLSYPSANHDETVFDNPMSFDIGRRPNPHIAFGFGPHFCLGAHLARMEVKAVFRELAARLQSAELAGQPQLAASITAGGLKHLPINCRVDRHRG